MKAVMTDVPQFILDWRRKTGADRFDEMWEGVLQMIPLPNFDHQNLEGALEAWLRQHSMSRDSIVVHQVAVSTDEDWTHDYRMPDLILIAADRMSMLRENYFHGGPTAAIELRSPGDETYEKLPFYADLGIPEVWVIDRDTKQPELHCWQQDGYVVHTENNGGWVHSAATDVELCGTEQQKLAIRIAGDGSTYAELPQ